jgi:hypothetical protein
MFKETGGYGIDNAEIQKKTPEEWPKFTLFIPHPPENYRGMKRYFLNILEDGV